jgi:hypothetical protein
VAIIEEPLLTSGIPISFLRTGVGNLFWVDVRRFDSKTTKVCAVICQQEYGGKIIVWNLRRTGWKLELLSGWRENSKRYVNIILRHVSKIDKRDY